MKVIHENVIDLSSLIGFDVLDLRTKKDERSELDGLNNTNQKRG